MASIQERSTSELLKGWWDPELVAHVPGLVERVAKIEELAKSLPKLHKLLWIIGGMQIATLVTSNSGHFGELVQAAFALFKVL